ncbi:transaldolase family protein [Prochlorococcus sp. MIT 1307]|uniref:transaldolase family protein n=1 Tax=Prochlorococcus sp. MIT 1307 TaxID=3096219 RepID=UPI002A757068|nr:transaldolase family protein [Prochlorococcus sp. MIT 1307]
MSISLLLDNADPRIWAKLFKSGLFNGITTNPTLLKVAGQPCTLSNIKELVKKAKLIGCKELHIQAWGGNASEIKACGVSIGSLSSPEMQVHVKIPITKSGSEAARELINANFSVTFTACYEIKQVLIAAAIGANYIAPYLGRINDQGRNGMIELKTMQEILQRTNSNCQILVASLRSISEINHLASQGIKIFTINERLAQDLFNCEETLKASEKFEEDASNC